MEFWTRRCKILHSNGLTFGTCIGTWWPQIALHCRHQNHSGSRKIQRIAKGRAGGKGPRQKTSKIVKKCRKFFDTFRAGQKTSKIFKKCQKVFRHFSTICAQGKECQKSSKSVKNFFDTFRQFSRGTSFPAPFRGF